MKKKPVRIKDIADKAGVSVGTVDRVIHKRGKVAKVKEILVRNAMEELQYEPNLAARSLAMQTPFKVAVIIPFYDNDAFWIDQLEGIKGGLQEIKNFGFTIDLLAFNDQKAGSLLKHKRKLKDGSYDAILLAPTLKEESIQFLNTIEKNKIPYVLVNTSLERKSKNFLGYIGQNSFQSGALAGKLLSFNNREKKEEFLVLHMEKEVGKSEHMIQKENGFKHYFEEKRKIKAKIIVEKTPDFADFKSLKSKLKRILKKHPKLKGVFVTTSRIHYLVEVLQALELDHLNIIGFDLIKENIEKLYTYDRMFLINQNPYLQGYYAIIHIFEHLLKKKEVRKKLYLPLDVITLENYRYYLHLNEYRLSQR